MPMDAVRPTLSASPACGWTGRMPVYVRRQPAIFSLLCMLFFLTLTGRAQVGAVNVKSAPYGAIGDGVHDDTAALQTALDAAAGVCIYLPSGNYRIARSLIYSNTTAFQQAPCILGAGMVKSIIIPNFPQSPPGTGAAWNNARLIHGTVDPGLPTGAGSGYNRATLIKVSGVTCITPPSFSPTIIAGAIRGLIAAGSASPQASSGAGCIGKPLIVANSYNPALLIQTNVNNNPMYGGHLADFAVKPAAPNPNTAGIVINGMRHSLIERVDIENNGDGIQFPLDYSDSGNPDQHQSDGIEIRDSIINHNMGWGVAGYDSLGTGGLTLRANQIELNSRGGVYSSTSFLRIIDSNSIFGNGCKTTLQRGDGSPGSVVCDFDPKGNGGGVFLDRVQAAGTGCYISNTEFDSNWLYQVSDNSTFGCIFENNRHNSWMTLWNDGFQHPNVHFLLGGFNYPNTQSLTNLRLSHNNHRSQNTGAGAAYDSDVTLYALLDNNVGSAVVENPFFDSNSSLTVHYATGAGAMVSASVAGRSVVGTEIRGDGGHGYTSRNLPAFAMPPAAGCTTAPVFGPATTTAAGNLIALPVVSPGVCVHNGIYALVATPVPMTLNEAHNRMFLAVEDNSAQYNGASTNVSQLNFLSDANGQFDITHLRRSAGAEFIHSGVNPASLTLMKSYSGVNDWEGMQFNSAGGIESWLTSAAGSGIVRNAGFGAGPGAAAFFFANGKPKAELDRQGNFSPVRDRAQQLGTTGQAWSNLYLAGITIPGPRGAIAAGACAPDVALPYPEVIASTAFAWSFNSRPPASYNSLTTTVYPTAGYANLHVCNPSSEIVVPAAATFNIRAIN